MYKIKKTVLMIALDQLTGSKNYEKIFDINKALDICKYINKEGYRVLLSTEDGNRLLGSYKNNKTSYDINYPVSLVQLNEEDMHSFAFIYIISNYKNTFEELNDIPQLNKIIEHCKINNKFIALNQPEKNEVIFPTRIIDEEGENIIPQLNSTDQYDFSIHLLLATEKEQQRRSLMKQL